MKRPMVLVAALAVGLVLAMASSAPARVKLVTLPERASITLSVEHPSQNLVQEERVLTLQKGVNKVDFNWQGVSINANAIVLEPLDHPEEIRLIAVRYPPGENALVWDVYSPRAMTERIRVTYFLNGIGREYAYRSLSDKPEENMELKQYLRLKNFSGERLEEVKVYTGFSEPYVTDLDQGEVRQRLIHKNTIPFTREFTWDDRVQPEDPDKVNHTVGIPITYVVTNRKEKGLGKFSLKYGKARIYQDDGRGSNAFLGEDWAAYTPVKEELKLSVGESRDIKVIRKKMEVRRTREHRNNRRKVVLWDQDEDYELTVNNFRDKDVAVTVLVHFRDTWDVKSATIEYEKEDYQTLKFLVPVAAGDSEVVKYTVERRNLTPGRQLR